MSAIRQQLAQLCAATGRPAEAAEAFRRAIAAGGSGLALALPLAMALSAAGEAAQAVAVALAAQARRPKEFLFTNLAGVVLRRAGRLKEAQAAFETARKLDPRAVSACQNLGNLHDQLGRFREAVAAYQAGLKIEPRNADLHRLHGRALRLGGDPKAAVQSFERALTLGAAGLDALTDLIGTLLDLGEEERGLAALARARQASPGDGRIDILEARVAFRLGRREAARALVERALEAMPGDVDGTLLLARLHGDGDLQGANAALRRGVAANPKATRLLSALIENLVRSRYGDEAEHLQEAYELGCRLLRTDPGNILAHAKSLHTVFLLMLDHDRLAASGSLADLAPRWIAEGNIAGLHYELGQVRSMEDRLRLVEWHREWGRREAHGITPLHPPATTAPADALAKPALATGRKLRIGFMSSRPARPPRHLFRAAAARSTYDRDRFEVFCYSFYPSARATRCRPSSSSRSPASAGGRAAHERGRRRHRRRRARHPVRARRHHRHEQARRHGASARRRIRRAGSAIPHSAGLEEIDYILVDPYHHAERSRAADRAAPSRCRRAGSRSARLGFRDDCRSRPICRRNGAAT